MAQAPGFSDTLCLPLASGHVYGPFRNDTRSARALLSCPRQKAALCPSVAGITQARKNMGATIHSPGSWPPLCMSEAGKKSLPDFCELTLFAFPEPLSEILRAWIARISGFSILKDFDNEFHFLYRQGLQGLGSLHPRQGHLRGTHHVTGHHSRHHHPSGSGLSCSQFPQEVQKQVVRLLRPGVFLRLQGNRQARVSLQRQVRQGKGKSPALRWEFCPRGPCGACTRASQQRP